MDLVSHTIFNKILEFAIATPHDLYNYAKIGKKSFGGKLLYEDDTKWETLCRVYTSQKQINLPEDFKSFAQFFKSQGL